MSSLEIAVSGAVRTLSATPSALITDIDGTISPIVARPEDAAVGEKARDALRRLADHLALVAVVTAREEAVARRMVGVEALTYVGNYALDDDTAARLAQGQLEGAKQSVRPLLASLPCVTFEDKGVAFSLHYRNCQDRAAVRSQLLTLVQPIAAAADARVLEGKQVIELVPRALPDKGSAIARLIQGRGVNGVVYLGDDLSDVAVFREITRRRVEEGLLGFGVAVVDAETDETVQESADARLAGVDEVEEFLRCLATSLERGGAG